MALFGSTISGPPPGTATVGASLWIPVLSIPAGFDIWIGSITFSSPYKVCKFDLRTNLSGQSAGTLAATKSLYAWTSSSKVKAITSDLYKNGTLHTATVVGTVAGEKLWILITSKSSTAVTYSYKVNYTQE